MNELFITDLRARVAATKQPMSELLETFGTTLYEAQIIDDWQIINTIIKQPQLSQNDCVTIARKAAASAATISTVTPKKNAWAKHCARMIKEISYAAQSAGRDSQPTRETFLEL